MAQQKGKTVVRRRRERKNIEQGQVHIQSTFNKQSLQLPICRETLFHGLQQAALGFRGSKKSTPFAAQTAAETAAKAAKEHGLKSVRYT